MTEQQRRYVLVGAGAVGVLCLVVWAFLLLRPAEEAVSLPNLVNAQRPAYAYNEASFITQNPEQFLAQMLPLLGTIEEAVAKGDEQTLQETSAILRTLLVRWRDALPATLQMVAVRPLEALDRLMNTEDPQIRAQSLQTLREIQTLALEQQRTSLQTFSR